MSKQKTHNKANVLLLGLSLILSLFLPLNITLCIGILIGYFINPDLDQPRKGLWGLIWFPYCLIFKHRGLSHNLIVGTTTRVIYLTILISPILYPYRTYLNQYLNTNLTQILFLLAGLWISDTVHIIMDSK